MSPTWVRAPLEREQEVAAAAVSAALGVGIGLVALYLLRLMLSREPLAGGPEAGREHAKEL